MMPSVYRSARLAGVHEGLKKSDGDRRRAKRVQRLISLSMEYEGLGVSLVTTDVSLRGAFVHAPPGFRLPIGFDLRCEYRGADNIPIFIRANIIRVITRPGRVSRIPGMALEFIAFECKSGVQALSEFIQNVLEFPLSAADTKHISIEKDGHATYTLGPQLRERLRLVPDARMVHAERNARSLPDDVKANEDMLRELVTDIERRRVKRHPCHVEVTWTVADNTMPYSGLVLNVSQRGIFVQTDHELPQIGTHVCFRFPVGEGNGEDSPYVKMEGTVRRRWDPSTEGLPGFGLRLDKIDELGKTGIFRMFLHRFGNKRGRRRRGFHYRAR